MAKKHMKRCSPSLINRKTQINTTMRYHFTPIRIAIIKTENKSSQDMEKLKPLCTDGGNVKWCSHCGKRYRNSSKILNTEFPYDTTIPLPDICPKDVKDICTPMFTAALFTIAKRWKRPRSPSKDERISKMLYIYKMEYYSALKRKKILTRLQDG